MLSKPIDYERILHLDNKLGQRAFCATKEYIKMTNIEYFKLQAKNLLKDYKTRHLSEQGDIYEYDPKFFDIVGIFLEYDIMDDDPKFEFSLGNAQHLIAQLVGFNKWDELVKASEEELSKARKILENHGSNEYGSTSFVSHNFTEDGREVTFFNHSEPDSDVEYHEELSGKDWQDGINECYANKMGFPADTVVECIHCGKRFPFGEVKVRRLKAEFNGGQEDDFKEIMCKHYPECNGNLLELIPAEVLDKPEVENEK